MGSLGFLGLLMIMVLPLIAGGLTFVLSHKATEGNDVE